MAQKTLSRFKIQGIAADPREIARVAYELYEQRGCEQGHDLDDWLKAEQMVRVRGGNGRNAS